MTYREQAPEVPEADGKTCYYVHLLHKSYSKQEQRTVHEYIHTYVRSTDRMAAFEFALNKYSIDISNILDYGVVSASMIHEANHLLKKEKKEEVNAS